MVVFFAEASFCVSQRVPLCVSVRPSTSTDPKTVMLVFLPRQSTSPSMLCAARLLSREVSRFWWPTVWAPFSRSVNSNETSTLLVRRSLEFATRVWVWSETRVWFWTQYRIWSWTWRPTDRSLCGRRNRRRETGSLWQSAVRSCGERFWSGWEGQPFVGSCWRMAVLGSWSNLAQVRGLPLGLFLLTELELFLDVRPVCFVEFFPSSTTWCFSSSILWLADLEFDLE